MILRYLFYYFMSLFVGNRYIFIKAWVEVEQGVCTHRNWGDELNEHIIIYLTNKKAVILPHCRLDHILRIDSYLCIGSILTIFDLNHTIVWGAGVINHNAVEELRGTPVKICAVRGPKTKYELEKKGIKCPEIYGDPALLMPRFYQPSIRKHYSMGIIPHWGDMCKENVKRLMSDPRVKLIKAQGYETWTDFIDEICSCDFIISSSLHGLIIAEAYGIPSQWVEFGSYDDGWEFKYHDFYESIGKMNEEPLYIDNQTSYEILMDKKKEWKKGSIDLDQLMAACPIR